MALELITPDCSEKISILICGKAGTGKTSTLKTIASKHKICVLAVEDGLLAVRDLVKDKRIDGYKIKSFADFKMALEAVSNDKHKERFDIIFIDGLSEISAICLDHFKPKYTGYTLWNNYTDEMTKIIKSFLSLKTKDYHIIMTALESIIQDENGAIIRTPAVAGKSFKEMLPSYFDEILFMTTVSTEEREDARIFICQPINGLCAKDRSGKLDVTEPPSLEHIINKILGTTKKEKTNE